MNKSINDLIPKNLSQKYEGKGITIDANPEKLLEIAAYYDRDRTIRNFYRKIWNTENKEDVYCVFLEQRCLNLNEIYFHEWISLLHYFSRDYEIPDLEYKYQNFFLTQDAWLTKAEKLVAYYEKHLEFPKTYIVEEFLLSAHDIGNAVFNMLKAIFCEYEKKHSLTEDVKSELKKAFLASLDIRVFVRDCRNILLENDVEKQISWSRNYAAENWWIYINDVAEKITMDENVENTTFMPTFYLSTEGYDKLRNYIGHSEVWRYKDKETEIWNNVVINENGKSKMIESMCIEFAEKNKEYHVTPYVILGNLSEAEMDLLFNYLLAVFSQTQNDVFKQFIHILKMPNEYAFDIKLSLCMSILSVLRMDRLIKASGITQDMLKGNDFDKISMNYGTVNETKIAFEALFEDTKFAETLRDQLSNTIINFLTQHAKSIPYSDCKSSDANATQAYCLKRAEDYFIDLEFKEEAQLQYRREKNIVYVPRTEFNNKECTISNYFKFFHTQNHKTSFNQQISAMLLLIHNGIIELKAVNTNGDSAFLKVGVITNLVAVNRRLFDYLPALIDLQKICKEQGEAFESWSGLFGRYLKRNHIGKESQNLDWEFQYYVNRFKHVKRNLSDLAPLCKELNTKNDLPNAYNETQEMYRRILRKILKKD